VKHKVALWVLTCVTFYLHWDCTRLWFAITVFVNNRVFLASFELRAWAHFSCLFGQRQIAICSTSGMVAMQLTLVLCCRRLFCSQCEHALCPKCDTKKMYKHPECLNCGKTICNECRYHTICECKYGGLSLVRFNRMQFPAFCPPCLSVSSLLVLYSPLDLESK
jgi:hypothetical protein